MNIANLNVKIGADLTDFNRSIANLTSSIQGVGQKLSSVGKNLTVGLTTPILALGTASVKLFGDIQSLKLGLEAVAGSSEEAEKQFQSLKKVAKLPGLGLEEAVKGSINLQTIGFSAEKAEQSLQVFGNAVASVGKGRAEFERAIYGLQQLANTDFPLGEDLNILKDAIPQITPLLKEAFGTARSDDFKKLGITSEQVVNTILTGLGKLPPVAGGINNAFENMGDSIKNSLAGLGESINRAFNVEGLLNTLADVVENLSEKFSKLSPVTQKIVLIFAGLAAAIGPLLVGLGFFITSIIPALVTGFTAISGALAGTTGAVLAITAVVLAFGTLAYGIYKSWDTFVAFFDRLWAETKVTFALALLDIITKVNSFTSNFGISFDKTEQVLKNFARATVENLNKTPLVTFEDANNAMRDSIINGFTSMKKTAIDFLTGTTAEANKTASSIDGVTKKVNGLTEAVQRMANVEPLQIKGADLGFSEAVKINVDVVGIEKLDLLKEKISEVGQKGVDLAAIFKEQLTTAIISFAESIGSLAAGGGMENFFNDIMGIVTNFIGSFGKALVAAGVAALAFQQLAINPGAAIVAGGVLIALAGLAKAQMQKGLGSTGGGGSTYTAASLGSGSYYRPKQDGVVEFEISGNNLRGVLRNQDKKDYRVGA